MEMIAIPAKTIVAGSGSKSNSTASRPVSLAAAFVAVTSHAY
jgi:hypothetical protein